MEDKIKCNSSVYYYALLAATINYNYMYTVPSHHMSTLGS